MKQMSSLGPTATTSVAPIFFPHFSDARSTTSDRPDAHGTPTKYYDCGSASERSGGVAPRSSAVVSVLRLGGSALLAAFVGRTELVGAIGLTLHAAGFAPPGLVEAARGHAPVLAVLYLVVSFVGAAYGYYAHCSKIEDWCDAQPPGSEKDWKVQPEKKASPESRALARRLGTFTERYLRPVGGRVKWVGRWRVDTP